MSLAFSGHEVFEGDISEPATCCTLSCDERAVSGLPFCYACLREKQRKGFRLLQKMNNVKESKVAGNARYK